MKKEELKIQIYSIGTSFGYEDYHNEYFLNGEKIGGSSYDKKQAGGTGLHNGHFEGEFWEKYKKGFYGKTPKGIAWKMQKKLEELDLLAKV